MQIDFTDLSVRSKNALLSSGIKDVESLMQAYVSGVNFKSIRNLGSKSLEEIKKFCAENLKKSNDSIDEFSDLNLSEEVKKIFREKGIYLISQLGRFQIDKDIEISDKLSESDKIILNSIIYVTSCSSIKSFDSKIPNVNDTASQKSYKSIGNTENQIHNKVAELFLNEIRLIKIEHFIQVEKYIIDLRIKVHRGHITDIDYLFYLIQNFVHIKFGTSFGSSVGAVDEKKIKSNNQIIHLFIRNKLSRFIEKFYITKDGIYDLLVSLEGKSDRWLLNRILKVLNFAYIELLNHVHVVYSDQYLDYIEAIHEVEFLSKSKLKTFQLNSSVFNDKMFVDLLGNLFPIEIDKNGVVTNHIGEIPVVEKIHAHLCDVGRPLSFEDLWNREQIEKSAQSGIRIKITRDKRFIVYGKLGFVGLLEWNLVIDDVLSGNIADNVILIIKRFDLSRLSFGSFSKLYSRLRRRITLESWKSNLQLSSDNLLISKNCACLVGYNYSEDNQIQFLSSIIERLEMIYENSNVSPDVVMQLAFEIALVDSNNFSTVCRSLVEDILSLVRTNIDLLRSRLSKVIDRIDIHFVEECMSLKLSDLENDESILSKFRDMILDGAITYIERDELAKWINQSKISLEQVKQRLSDSIFNGDIILDKQVSYIFQYRGIDKLSFAELLADLNYLLFDVANINTFVLKCDNLIIEEDFCKLNEKSDVILGFEFEIFGKKLIVNLKKSYWDNVTFDYSEISKAPCVNVYARNIAEKKFLIEDGILAYLVSENIIQPLNIVKVRNKIREKLKLEYQEFLE